MVKKMANCPIFCTILLVFTQCLSSHSSSANSNFRNGGSQSLDRIEIARQNRITERILQNYLQKKLFPHQKQLQVNADVPTIWEILPKNKVTTNSIQDALGNTTSTPTNNETLESGESEQVSSFYDEDEDNNIDDYYQGMQI